MGDALLVSEGDAWNPGAAKISVDINDVASGIAAVALEKLSPSTTYSFGLRSDTNTQLGRVRTFAPEGQPTSFMFTFGSCSKWVGSGAGVWEAIAERDPLFMLHLGDLFYGDITQDDSDLFRQQYKTVVTAAGQNKVFSKLPVSISEWESEGSRSSTCGMTMTSAQTKRTSLLRPAMPPSRHTTLSHRTIPSGPRLHRQMDYIRPSQLGESAF